MLLLSYHCRLLDHDLTPRLFTSGKGRSCQPWCASRCASGRRFQVWWTILSRNFSAKYACAGYKYAYTRALAAMLKHSLGILRVNIGHDACLLCQKFSLLCLFTLNSPLFCICSESARSIQTRCGGGVLLGGLLRRASYFTGTEFVLLDLVFGFGHDARPNQPSKCLSGMCVSDAIVGRECIDSTLRLALQNVPTDGY